jgi:membrane protease YdiL (CAAX protease family)
MAALTLSAVILMPFADSIQTKGFDMLALPRGKLISLQVLQMIGFFILPPVLFALFSKNDFLSCFNLDKLFTIKKYLLASAIALLLFPVLINFQYWAMSAPLPESFKAMAELQKAMNEKVIGIFLNEPGLANLGLMVVMIGIGAGLTEELFFRGLLMPWIEKITKNTWAAIILSGTIFSFFHANFYDFFPIVIVGILFGYIYSKTRDLKLNIFIHALYNSAQVVLNYLHENKYIEANLEEVKSIPILIWFICLSIVAFLIYKLVTDYEDLPHTS